jgi:hypothetical protein
MAAGFADNDGRGIDGPAGISCINVDRGIDDAAKSWRHCALLPPPVSPLGIGRLRLLGVTVQHVPLQEQRAPASPLP